MSTRDKELRELLSQVGSLDQVPMFKRRIGISGEVAGYRYKEDCWLGKEGEEEKEEESRASFSDDLWARCGEEKQRMQTKSMMSGCGEGANDVHFGVRWLLKSTFKYCSGRGVGRDGVRVGIDETRSVSYWQLLKLGNGSLRFWILL